MITFTLLHPEASQEMLGYLPGFFSDLDSRPAKAQIDTAYSSGFMHIRGMKFEPQSRCIKYPGDPRLMPIAEAKLHKDTDQEETLLFYDHELLVILQLNGDFECSRVS